MHSILAKAMETHTLSKDEIVFLLGNALPFEEVCASADIVRHKYVGDAIHLRGLIEFSNICKNNCCYCGLRRDNKNIERYRIEAEEIIQMATVAVQELGLKTIVLQSGEDMYFTTDKLCFIIQGIKKLGVALTLSIGEKTLEEYQAYHKAGADRFLLRIETTDKDVYARNDPSMSWENRANCLTNLRKAGLEVGSGSLIGLPGQTVESLADDILFFKEIDADMLGYGPLIPHPDTPLRDVPKGDFELAIRVMAVTRLLLPDINIPATTAMETLRPDGQRIALQAGANVIMPNVTLTTYRKNYELYPGKSNTGYTPKKTYDELVKKIESIGRYVGTDCGFRVKRQVIGEDTTCRM